MLTDGESEFTLAPLLAGNVYVAAARSAGGSARRRPAAVGPAVGRSSEKWSSLDPGCRGFIRRRLLDLGFTPGARLRPVLTTFAGDPRAYRVRGTTIALRREQSARVLVRAVA